MNLPVELLLKIIQYSQSLVVSLIDKKFHSVWKLFIDVKPTSERLLALCEQRDIRVYLPIFREKFEAQHLEECIKNKFDGPINFLCKNKMMSEEQRLYCSRWAGKYHNMNIFQIEEFCRVEGDTFFSIKVARAHCLGKGESGNFYHMFVSTEISWYVCGLILSGKQAKIVRTKELSVVSRVYGRRGDRKSLEKLLEDYKDQRRIEEEKGHLIGDWIIASFFQGCLETGRKNIVDEMVKDNHIYQRGLEQQKALGCESDYLFSLFFK